MNKRDLRNWLNENRHLVRSFIFRYNVDYEFNHAVTGKTSGIYYYTDTYFEVLARDKNSVGTYDVVTKIWFNEVLSIEKYQEFGLDVVSIKLKGKNQITLRLIS